MFDIRYATEGDKEFWFTLDRHISEDELLLKIRDKRIFCICNDGKPIGERDSVNRLCSFRKRNA